MIIYVNPQCIGSTLMSTGVCTRASHVRFHPNHQTMEIYGTKSKTYVDCRVWPLTSTRMGGHNCGSSSRFHLYLVQFTIVDFSRQLNYHSPPSQTHIAHCFLEIGGWAYFSFQLQVSSHSKLRCCSRLLHTLMLLVVLVSTCAFCTIYELQILICAFL